MNPIVTSFAKACFRFSSLALVVGGLLASTTTAKAVTTVYSLLNLGQYNGTAPTTQGATGFISAYTNQSTYDEVFGSWGDVRGKMNVNIGNLAGQTITSATLSFSIIDTFINGGSTTLSSFASTGILTPTVFNNDTALLSTTFDLVTGANSVDITSFVQERLDSASDQLGLVLKPTIYNANGFTLTRNIGTADAALVRLTVVSSPSAVPEPSTYAAIFGVLALGAAAYRRRQARA